MDSEQLHQIEDYATELSQMFGNHGLLRQAGNYMLELIAELREARHARDGYMAERDMLREAQAGELRQLQASIENPHAEALRYASAVGVVSTINWTIPQNRDDWTPLTPEDGAGEPS